MKDQAKARISVILPMYNEEAYIGPCLESLREQTFPLEEMEILVVDGESTDGSAQIVRELVPKFPNLRLVPNPERRTPQALNVGIRAATADRVICLSCHATYTPNWIERSWQLLDETEAVCTGGRLIAQPGSEGLVARAICAAQSSPFGTGGARWRSGGSAGYVDSTAFGCFPRALFDEIGLYDRRLPRNQDTEMFGRIRASGYKIYFDPDLQAVYFTRGSLASYVRMLFRTALYLCPTWRINLKSFRPRHLVPALFVLGLVVGAVSLFAFRPLAWAAGAGLALYLLLDLAFSVSTASGHGWALLLVMPWLFPLTHVVYGLGTIAGLLRFGLRPVAANPEVRRPPADKAPER